MLIPRKSSWPIRGPTIRCSAKSPRLEWQPMTWLTQQKKKKDQEKIQSLKSNEKTRSHPGCNKNVVQSCEQQLAAPYSATELDHTFFLSLPRIWHRRFVPSKHMASRRPLPSIFVTWAYSGSRKHKLDMNSMHRHQKLQHPVTLHAIQTRNGILMDWAYAYNPGPAMGHNY